MRKPGWETRLAAAIALHQAAEPALGTADCGLLAWDCAAAVLGEDAMPLPRPAGYRDAKGAARHLKALGVRSVAGAMALHFDEVHPAQACRGDLGTVTRRGFTAAGVFTASGLLVRTRDGFVCLGARDVTRAFRIG